MSATYPMLASPAPGLLHTLARTAQSLWLACLGWHIRRTTRAALGALDARTLRDIGIDRSEIESIARDIDVVLAWRRRAARRRARGCA
jgi:uncharacterized protein YjiS (DUF1127 family)